MQRQQQEMQAQLRAQQQHQQDTNLCLSNVKAQLRAQQQHQQDTNLCLSNVKAQLHDNKAEMKKLWNYETSGGMPIDYHGIESKKRRFDHQFACQSDLKRKPVIMQR
jgi:hypothetical protein